MQGRTQVEIVFLLIFIHITVNLTIRLIKLEPNSGLHDEVPEPMLQSDIPTVFVAPCTTVESTVIVGIIDIVIEGVVLNIISVGIVLVERTQRYFTIFNIR